MFEGTQRQLQTQGLSASYALGYHAGINGSGARLCPYSGTSIDGLAWLRGHSHGSNTRPNALNFATRELNEQTGGGE